MNNPEALLYGGLEIFVSILLGTILLFSVYRILEKYIRKKHEIETNNVAYSIYCSSVLLSVGYLVAGIHTPILNTIRLLNSSTNSSITDTLLQTFLYSSIYLFVLIIIIAIVIISATMLFNYMTKNISEFKEIKKNNIATGIILGVIVLCIAIIVKDSIYLVIESFVPYPEIKNFI
jgi:uncharacterized membrane protein YjfL (UPF0719 family)